MIWNEGGGINGGSLFATTKYNIENARKKSKAIKVAFWILEKPPFYDERGLRIFGVLAYYYLLVVLRY